jgi:hypothetical protein
MLLSDPRPSLLYFVRVRGGDDVTPHRGIFCGTKCYTYIVIKKYPSTSRHRYPLYLLRNWRPAVQWLHTRTARLVYLFFLGATGDMLCSDHRQKRSSSLQHYLQSLMDIQHRTKFSTDAKINISTAKEFPRGIRPTSTRCA